MTAYSKAVVRTLWSAVCKRFPDHRDDVVSVRGVSPQEIRTLNRTYRNKDQDTNVLTFSYPESDCFEHDIALCIDVARREAQERGIVLRDYVALLIVHAMLHAIGLDHERSEAELQTTQVLEREILLECGFVSTSLSDVY